MSEKEAGTESASTVSAPAKASNAGSGAEEEEEEDEHDPQFEPIISLPLVQLPDCQAHEVTLLRLRAKLFRLDRSGDAPEWKERGTGDVQILRHENKPRARLLMRRDKTFKVCANHFVTPEITLRPNCDSDRAWVWSVAVDFSDEEPKPETLAIRFANAENAKKFKEAFMEAQKIVEEAKDRATQPAEPQSPQPAAETSDGLSGKLASLSVQEGGESPVAEPAPADSSS